MRSHGLPSAGSNVTQSDRQQTVPFKENQSVTYGIQTEHDKCVQPSTSDEMNINLSSDGMQTDSQHPLSISALETTDDHQVSSAAIQAKEIQTSGPYFIKVKIFLKSGFKMNWSPLSLGKFFKFQFL